MALPVIIYKMAEKDIMLGLLKYQSVNEMLEHLRALRAEFEKDYPMYKSIDEAILNQKY